MEKLVLIKLGGSVITDKSKEFTARPAVIKRLAKEIKKASELAIKLIVGHGGGSFPHRPAKKYQTKLGIINKNSLKGMSMVEEAARRLDAIIITNFIEAGLPIYPFSPGSFLISDAKGYIKSYIDPIQNALNINVIPLTYGDVVMDRKTGFTIFSTEKILSHLARKLKESYKIRVVYVADVDGVYGKDGKVIPAITDKNFDQLKESILGAKGADVTGGMLHKVEESLQLAKDVGVETMIVNGLKTGLVEKAISGKPVLSTKISVS